jgi:hypothetical protein
MSDPVILQEEINPFCIKGAKYCEPEKPPETPYPEMSLGSAHDNTDDLIRFLAVLICKKTALPVLGISKISKPPPFLA